MLAALNLPKSGSHIVMTLSYRRLMQVCNPPPPHPTEQWRGTGCSCARGWCNCSQGELSRRSPVRFSGNMKIKIDSWRAKTQKEGEGSFRMGLINWLCFSRRGFDVWAAVLQAKRTWEGLRSGHIYVLICKRSWGELYYTDAAWLDTCVTHAGLSLRAIFCIPNRLRSPLWGPLVQPLSSLQCEIKLGHLLRLLPSSVSVIMGSESFPALSLWSFWPLSLTG